MNILSSHRNRSVAVWSAAALLIGLIVCGSYARSPRRPQPTPGNSGRGALSLDRAATSVQALRAAAVDDTTVQGAWDFNTGCGPDGWTSVDRTAQTGTFFHIDDFAGLGGGDFGRLVPIEGNQSLWCGARPSASEPLCTYALLPGYGNAWDQLFATVDCLNVIGNVTVDYLIAWDSEPLYDYTTLQYDLCDDNWVDLEGGLGVWEGIGSGSYSSVVPDAAHSGQVRLRFRFFSDPVWSDEDDLWDTDGAVILDSLTVNDATGVLLPTEDFEAEAVAATATLSGNWVAAMQPPYGNYAAVMPLTTVLQEDPCRSDLSCAWGFFSGSTYNFSCGGHPEQAVVPYGNARGQYLHNEIWSPWMPLTGSGKTFELAFDVYLDLPLDPLVFYDWHVRTRATGMCASPWRNYNWVHFDYNSPPKEWMRHIESIGELLDPGATEIQVALGVRDECWRWCWSYGTGNCHTHAPLFDNIEVRRIDTIGPQWSVRAINLFQDNFASDGTTTGTVRADAAIGLLPKGDPNIRPGDSVAVHVTNPDGRLAADSYTGVGSAVYTYVSVRPSGQPGKGGSSLTEDPSRWPVVDSLVHDGSLWYCLRMDSAFIGGTTPDTAFCIDLNDDLFTPGDTIFYVFGATGDQPAVETTYYSRFTGTTIDMAHAFSNPMEFTCLPTQRANQNYPISGRVGASTGPILYVDMADGQGVQQSFDAAFDGLGITAAVDRYDVLDPEANDGNRPAGRVTDVVAQLVSAYRLIIWSSGDVDYGAISADHFYPVKTDDAGMLVTFLDSLEWGGVYLTGNNLADQLSGLDGTGATLRNEYIQFSVLNGDHTDLGIALSPLAVGTDGGMFDHPAGPDSIVTWGECPAVAAFDVLQPGGLARAEMAYTWSSSSHTAVVSQLTRRTQTRANVVLSGFSFGAIRDIPSNEDPPDVEDHLFDILMSTSGYQVVPGTDGTPFGNHLAQNVPNPFNPVTAIEFSVKERTPVTLRVYNVRGQLVNTLVDDTRAPGIAHRIEWDGRNDAGQQVASGVYFYRLVTKGFTSTKKMVLLK